MIWDWGIGLWPLTRFVTVSRAAIRQLINDGKSIGSASPCCASYYGRFGKGHHPVALYWHGYCIHVRWIGSLRMPLGGSAMAFESSDS